MKIVTRFLLIINVFAFVFLKNSLLANTYNTASKTKISSNYSYFNYKHSSYTASVLPFQQLNVNIYRTVGNQFADGIVALFGSQYSAAVNSSEDINKFTNFNETFSLKRNNQLLGLEARPLLIEKDTLYFNLGNFGQRDYTMVIDGNNFVNAAISLEDKYTGTHKTISLTSSTTYTFTINSDAASSANDRFIITLQSLPATKIMWTGLTDNSFNNANNWDLARTPFNSDSVVIASATNMPVLTANETLFKVIVNPSASISVASGATLSVMHPILLQSSAMGTACIANSAGTINSNVTVERFVPSNNRRKYVMLGSPVTSTINAGWQERNTTISGFGTHITGNVVQDINGFDGPITSGNSIFTYNDNANVGSKWSALISTTASATLAPCKGYLVYIRGDRSEDRPLTQTTSNTTLRATGMLSTGTITPTLLSDANKYTLIANPYPCAIDWNSTGIGKLNVTGVFTVYDSNLGVFISSDGYNKTPNTGNQQANYIQSGQAFFIQNTAIGNGSINFTEAAKTTIATTSSNTTVFGNTGIKNIKQQLNINAYQSANNQFVDGVVVLFDAVNKNIAKFTNFYETLSLTKSNQDLGLYATATTTVKDTLSLKLTNFTKKDYNFIIEGSNLKCTNATLEDKYTNTKQAIDLNGITTYKFSINNDVSSFASDRFIVTINNKPTEIIDSAFSITLFPNPVKNQLLVNFKTATIGSININIINSLGQMVLTTNAGNLPIGNILIPVNNLASGIYSVQILSNGKPVAAQQLIKK